MDNHFTTMKFECPPAGAAGSSAIPGASNGRASSGGTSSSRRDAIASHRAPSRRNAMHDGASPRTSGHRHTHNRRNGRGISSSSSSSWERPAVGAVGGSGTGSGATRGPLRSTTISGGIYLLMRISPNREVKPRVVSREITKCC